MMNMVKFIKIYGFLGGVGKYRVVYNKLVKQVNYFKYLGNFISLGGEGILKLRD